MAKGYDDSEISNKLIAQYNKSLRKKNNLTMKEINSRAETSMLGELDDYCNNEGGKILRLYKKYREDNDLDSFVTSAVFINSALNKFEKELHNTTRSIRYSTGKQVFKNVKMGKILRKPYFKATQGASRRVDIFMDRNLVERRRLTPYIESSYSNSALYKKSKYLEVYDYAIYMPYVINNATIAKHRVYWYNKQGKKCFSQKQWHDLTDKGFVQRMVKRFTRRGVIPSWITINYNDTIYK